MNVELWDVLDANGNPTGRRIVRGTGTLRPGEYHLVVHIWIISADGKILIQRRSDEKKLMPGEWAATGGAAISGESSFEAARRELFEELGIKANKDNLVKLLRLKRKNSFLDVWITTTDTPAEKLVLQKSEVDTAKWIKMPELEGMIENGEFHNYGEHYFDSVFEKIEDYRGTFV
ncbi:MAG: NUDIX domain-containing protein [Clostridia bacterium]|nr:NUDIX domain-containing protein [Clostridia bacterium]